jgi:LysM repeat protein
VAPTPTPVVHVVRSGDTLFGIAEYYGLSVGALLQANGLTEQSTLHPDDTLIIPLLPAPTEASTAGAESSPTATASLDNVVHTVQPGESLRDIVQRYGISLEELLAANSLESGVIPQAGDALTIPVSEEPLATNTPVPTATPTPGAPFPAPRPLYPAQNAPLLTEEAVVLQWASSGILAEDEWYAISLRYLGQRAGGQPSEIVVYTRITSWRVPEQWAPDPQASERRFEWRVQVVRRSELGESPAPLSVPSELRKFRW